MKLYYVPGACSLAPHIALSEAGINAKLDKVAFGPDTRTTAEGADFYKINPQGAVPTLELDDGSVMTENAVLLQYIAAQAPQAKLAPADGMALWRLRETLNFVATELHKSFSPLFRNPPPEARAAAVKHLLTRFKLLSGKLGDKQYLMGADFTVADAYAYVMLFWAKRFELDLSATPSLGVYFARLQAREGVRKALTEEGLATA